MCMEDAESINTIGINKEKMCLIVNKGDVFVWDTELLVKSASMMLIHTQEKEMYRQTCI